jgi:hypothetical protein
MKQSLLLVIAALSMGISGGNADPRLTANTTTDTPAVVAQKALRRVKGQVLTSTELPAIRLKFDKNFKYAGGHEFDLFGESHAEQHFFVDADRDGRVKRMYWVQFESYLPSSQHTYEYKVNQTVNMGGLNFLADAYTRNIKANPGHVDSEGRRARAFLQSKGYHMESDEGLYQRLLYLTDEKKRHMMVIVYLEDMSGMGLKAVDFEKGGSGVARWDEISKSLLTRAMKGMKVSR